MKKIEEIPIEIQKRIEREIPITAAYDRFMQALKKDDIGNTIFPEDFGGEYMDYEKSGKLVVKLVKPTNERKTEYYELFKNCDNIVFEETEFSINYLATMSQYINELIKEEIEPVRWGVNHKDGTYIIDLHKDDLDKLKQLDIYKQLEKLPIAFYEAKDFQLHTNLYGGNRIGNTITDICSIGFCGTYQNNPAIITCGHGNAHNTTLYYGYLQSNIFASISYQSLNIGKGDFSIATILDSSFVTTNSLANGKIVSAVIANDPYVGQTLYKYGSVGQLATLSYVGKYARAAAGDIYFADITNGSSELGDSGGPWYIPIGTNGCSAVGTHMGLYSGQAICSPASYAKSHFSFKIW